MSCITQAIKHNSIDLISLFSADWSLEIMRSFNEYQPREEKFIKFIKSYLKIPKMRCLSLWMKVFYHLSLHYCKIIIAYNFLKSHYEEN